MFTSFGVYAAQHIFASVAKRRSPLPATLASTPFVQLHRKQIIRIWNLTRICTCASGEKCRLGSCSTNTPAHTPPRD